jgi:tripartite-type tricarboxylate transporter receptor subunit TctC
MSRFVVVLLALPLTMAAASASHAADFYAGKQITIVSSSAGGGAYDTYSRALARYMGKYIPGNPVFIVQNLPGASGLRAANFAANAAPKDGTVIAGTHSGVPTYPLTNPGEAQYDATKLAWIGSATKDVHVGYVMNTAPIRSVEDAMTKPATLGGTAAGSLGSGMTLLANEFFGTKFKQVLGYKDAFEVRLALERGEIDGTFGTNYMSAFKVEHPEWIRDGKAFIIIQFGLKRYHDIPDVPTFMDFAKTEEQRQAIRFMVARLDYGKPYFAPAEIPADRLEILRRAFDATVKDPDFIKEIVASQLEVDEPITGEELAKVVADQAATPKPIVKRLASMVGGE